MPTRLILCALTLGLGGCGWLADRGRDFVDVGILSGDVGPGIGVHAQITDILRLGYEDKSVLRLGGSTRVVGMWTEERETWSLSGLGAHALTHGEMTIVGVDYWDRYSQLDPWPSAAKVFTRQRYAGSGEGVNSRWEDRQVADVGFSVHLGWVGMSAFLRPLEMVDFLVGWCGLDLAGDDLHIAFKE